MQIVALLSTYNESRFIEPCLNNFIRQGVEVYLIDNDSTDDTVVKAKAYLGRGLIKIETRPRQGVYENKAILQRKEILAQALEAEWFIQTDADEIRLPPNRYASLQAALTQADAAGYNAANFMDFVFIPVAESPDHDRPNFQETMRWYYPFQPFFPHRLTAWKRQPGPVNLAETGGHCVKFPGLRMSPELFKMRHYMGLSIPQLIEKYGQRRYPSEEIAHGWHGWRAELQARQITLPSQTEMRLYISDNALDASQPRLKHNWVA